MLIYLLNNKLLIFCMKIFRGRTYLPFHITMPKIDDIGRNDYLKYNCQSCNSTDDKICVENGRFFYFNDHVRLDLYYICFEMPRYLKNAPIFI